MGTFLETRFHPLHRAVMTLRDELPQVPSHIRPEFRLAEPDRIEAQMTGMRRNPGFRPCIGFREAGMEGQVSPVNGSRYAIRRQTDQLFCCPERLMQTAFVTI